MKSYENGIIQVMETEMNTGQGWEEEEVEAALR